MRKIKFEKHRDIFKHFTSVELEKAERVLSAVKEYAVGNFAEILLGISIKYLKCTEDDVKKALPVLESIKNNLFKSNIQNEEKSNVEGLMLYVPTQDITLTRDKKLTGFCSDNFLESTLEEIQLYLSKNKAKNISHKIPLTLSKIGLKNELNGEVYTITGKRAEYIKIIKNIGPLKARELVIETKQTEKTISDAIQDINELSLKKLDLIEKLIISSGEGYILNPLYKIKILK